MASRGLTGIAALLIALFALVALFAAPALADRTYEAQITGFTSPYGIAFDSSDNAWVLDRSGRTITEYEAYPSLTQITQIDDSHLTVNTEDVAVNQATGYVYASPAGSVDVFDDTGALSDVWVLPGDCGSGLTWIAVDNSSSPSNGVLYAISRSCGELVALGPGGSPASFSATGDYIDGNALTGTPGRSFGTFRGVTVDTDGNIYVAEGSQVDKFAPSGAFLRSFNGAGAPGSFTPTGVAVDPVSGNVLIALTGNPGRVDEFDSNGNFLGQITGTGAGQATPLGSLSGGIAVDSAGHVYLSDSTNRVVDVFSPNAVVPKVTYGEVSGQTDTAGTLNATVDPNGGGDITTCAFEYGTDTSYGLGSVPCDPDPAGSSFSTPTDVSVDLSGLTTETTYHYRVVVGNANGTKFGADQTFTPHHVLALSCAAASDVSSTGATLNGSFVGDGTSTQYHFEWGADTSYGDQSPTASVSPAAGAAQDVTYDLTGLAPQTTYHYRVAAGNGGGDSLSDDCAFTTLPAVAGVQTKPATNVSGSSATLNGSFDGDGRDTHYYFEWGTDTSYGNTTAAPPGLDAGSGSGTQSESADLSGLRPHTLYHYRFVASNPAGVTYGLDQTFTTLGRYEFSTTLGAGSGSGDGELESPLDVAVDDASGAIYVADTGNHRVVKLTADGSFVSAWGSGVADGSPGAEVCASGCQAGIAGSGPGEFTAPTFIEVDNSHGPSAGDVYVADTNNGVVQKFDPSGNLITSWGEGGAMDFSRNGVIGGITVDTAGDLYVLGTSSPYYWARVGQDGVFKTRYPTDNSFNGGQFLNLGTPNGTGIEISTLGAFYELQPPGNAGVMYSSPSSTIYSSFQVYSGNAITDSGIAINRSNDDLFVDQGIYIDWFPAVAGCGADIGSPGPEGPDGCEPSDRFGRGLLRGAAGLAVRSTNGVLYAANSGDDNIAVFAPRPVPDVTTGPVANPGPTSGTLTGHVDPQGGSVSDCHFEYGTDTTYGLGAVPCEPGVPLTGPTDVSADIGGLTPFETYHYRLVATRADGDGIPAYGRDRTFTAGPTQPPAASGGAASDITPTSATLTAQVNPNQAPTIYRFEYGPSTDYGAKTPTSDPIGDDDVAHDVSAQLAGLTPGATYHFRILAINVNGVSAGPDRTFVTPAPPSVSGGAASDVSQTGATLHAVITPGFRDTTYHFEYGTSADYGSRTAESPSIGSDNVGHLASASIGGLAAGTTYHFRVVATNAIATVAGSDHTFTTPPAPQSTAPPQRKCKKGFVKRHGRCVKRKRHRKRHHHRHHKRKHAKKHRGSARHG